jgi:hypothetical protein
MRHVVKINYLHSKNANSRMPRNQIAFFKCKLILFSVRKKNLGKLWNKTNDFEVSLPQNCNNILKQYQRESTKKMQFYTSMCGTL